jgi:hypothetical protein
MEFIETLSSGWIGSFHYLDYEESRDRKSR